MSIKYRDLEGKSYWLVGASAGIGAALAVELDQRGAKLVLSSRSEDELTKLASRMTSEAKILACDVTQDASVEMAFDALGQIDGVIYMAGAYVPLDVKNWDREASILMADVNYLGALRVLSRCARDFQTRGDGHIFIVGSLAGLAGLPGAIGYGASKAAVMHLSENLQADLKGTGVAIQVANPGFVKTRLTDKNDFKMPFIQTPEQAATCIADHMRSRRFSKSFPSTFAWVFKLRAIWKILRS